MRVWTTVTARDRLGNAKTYRLKPFVLKAPRRRYRSN
jgi:hypothetical protein